MKFRSARVSIIFSVIRIDPEEKRQRQLLIVAILFLITFAVLTAQLFWVCEANPAWKRKKNPQCPLTMQVAIFQLICALNSYVQVYFTVTLAHPTFAADIIADSLLLVAPLRLLQNLLNMYLRRRLFFIFSTSIVTTIVSLVHAVYIFKHGGSKVLVAAFVEVNYRALH